MKILTTGAKGFVGSHCTEALQKSFGAELVAACRDPDRLLPLFRGTVRQGDLRAQEYLQEVTQDVDVNIPADFPSDSQGRLTEVFYGTDIGDHIPLTRIVDRLDAGRKDAGTQRAEFE